MSIVSEFKEFAFKGNMIDMAVGLIIGAAFTTVVKSVVDDLVMPPIGMLTGGIDFGQLSWVVQAAAEAPDGTPIPEVAIRYGAFINNTLTFFVVGSCVFLIVKAVNTARKRFEAKEEAAPAAPQAPSPEVVLLTEIRDALRERA